MKIKDTVKSKRVWAIAALLISNLFGVQLPDVIHQTVSVLATGQI